VKRTRIITSVLSVITLSCGSASAFEAGPPFEASLAFEASSVSIVEAHSFNSGGHLWFKISGNSDCPTPTPYFIIQRWDDQTEPTKTIRQLTYQMALMAFAAGKSIRAMGSTCYLNQYLFLDQIIILD
jgi:hypothetical protein